jgi:hypothetical protein
VTRDARRRLIAAIGCAGTLTLAGAGCAEPRHRRTAGATPQAGVVAGAANSPTPATTQPDREICKVTSRGGTYYL